MGKKRKKGLSGRHLVVISSIIAINTMGMSYAYWTDQIQVNKTFSTGSIEPAFCADNYWINIVRDGGDQGNYQGWDDKWINESKSSNLNIQIADNGQTINISGELEAGYKAFIHYCVVNDGTVPIKLSKEREKLDLNGLTVIVNQQSQVLNPQEKLYTENSNGNPKIEIQIPNKLDGELYQKFEINLPFNQWTGNAHEGWQKTLKILGNIMVVPPVKEPEEETINQAPTIDRIVDQQTPLTEDDESSANFESTQTQSLESTGQIQDDVGDNL